MKAKYIIGTVFILTILSSCNGNRLKTDEKSLAKQILTEEEQLAHEAELRAEREKQLADSIAKLPKGFRFQEDRSVDSNNPPVIIDIIGSRAQTSQPIKLSKLFSKIEYIKLEQVQDSNELKLGAFYIVAPNHIYMTSRKGSIFQYNSDGRFIKTVCTGNLHYTEHKGSMIVTKDQFDQFEGARSAYWNGNQICYLYENRPAQKAYVMAVDDSQKNDLSGVQVPGSEENTINRINGSGKIVSEIKKTAKQYAYSTPYLLGGNMYAFAQRGKRVETVENFINILSVTGDTLCEFPDHDPIRNFTKSIYRGVDDGNSYYLNGSLFIRQSFNDTIYQLVPPNRLIPRYILNFGDLGIQSAQTGIDPGYNLQEKLVPQSFIETNRHLFITYSKDYSCPNTAKSGTLKYSRLVYDKKSGTLTPVYIDEAPFIPQGKMAWPQAPDLNIENDLDKMPFKWPESATAGGQPFSIFMGKELLEIKNQNFPLKNITENDRIIAIYH